MSKETFKKLSEYEHIRLRLEMYLGSRELHEQELFGYDGKSYSVDLCEWIPSLYVAYRELIDNALDETCQLGHGDRIDITFDPVTMEFSVMDNGRGIPIHVIKSLGTGPAASILLGETRTGRNFDARDGVAGMNGIGASIVNFASSSFRLEIWRDKQYFKQTWNEGTSNRKPASKTKKASIKPYIGKKRGTKITFTPSSSVWKKQIISEKFMFNRLWDIALNNPKLKLYYNGNRLTVNNSKKKTPIISIFGDSAVEIVFKAEGFLSTFTITSFEKFHIHSMVNNINTFEGGTHVDEFTQLFFTKLAETLNPIVMKELGIKKAKKRMVTLSDVMNNLLIHSVTIMNEPSFNSQTKDRLITETKSIMNKGFKEESVIMFIKKNSAWVEDTIKRCVSRLGKRNDRDIERANRKLNRTKIASLRDATSKNRQDCTLFITEGLSATAGLLSARDSRIHGALPLKGKILNVNGLTKAKLMTSETIRNILASTGLVFGVVADRTKLRYGNIMIATDADEDGKNISCLLVNLFHYHWPELFNDDISPFIFEFHTPLLIMKKGKTKKYLYSEKEYKPSSYKGYEVSRAKGLARLEQDDWKFSLKTMKTTPMIDDGKLGDVLDLLFSKTRSNDRKEWLQS